MQLLDYYRSRFGQAVKHQGKGWNGPCPLCGGQPGKSDRFMVWPERSEKLGELCAQNSIAGIWSCRKCGQSGDTIAYLTKCEGMSFKEALAELGIEGSKPVHRRRQAPAEPAKPEAWKPKHFAEPSRQWLEQAQKLLEKAEKRIWDNPQALAWLGKRGIGEEAIRKYRIGYLPAERVKYQGSFRPRASFGLDAKTGADGKRHEKLFIPRGILIPTFSAAGVINLRIRRHKEDLRERSPKYLELEGSCKGPMFLEAAGARPLAVYFITEAELDAMLIHHASGGVAGAVAVRTNRGKPDARCQPYLQAAARICVALDYDEAGADGCGFWEATYPNSLRWPTPEGKDPGDAFALGVDIREWIAASLPDCVALPDEKAMPHISEEIQVVSESGQEDGTASGPLSLGGGENPEYTDVSGNWPSENRARIEARAMAQDYNMEICRWEETQPEPFPRASENDFTLRELELIKWALPPETQLGDIYLDVAVIWLLWRNIPVTFIGYRDEEGNSTGFTWAFSHSWKARNSGSYEFFWRHQCASRALWQWLSDHPAERIDSGNLLHLRLPAQNNE